MVPVQGIVAAKLGATVCITDRADAPEVQTNCTRTCALNGVADRTLVVRVEACGLPVCVCVCDLSCVCTLPPVERSTPCCLPWLAPGVHITAITPCVPLYLCWQLPFSWGVFLGDIMAQEPFDLVIGSDILYDSERRLRWCGTLHRPPCQ